MSLGRANYQCFMLFSLAADTAGSSQLIAARAHWSLGRAKRKHRTHQLFESEKTPIRSGERRVSNGNDTVDKFSRWTFVSCFLHARMPRSWQKAITSIGAFQLAPSSHQQSIWMLTLIAHMFGGKNKSLDLIPPRWRNRFFSIDAHSISEKIRNPHSLDRPFTITDLGT